MTPASYLDSCESLMDAALNQWTCMQAEAEYWKCNQGYRTGWSDELLGFDCGGQQWVLETCFPAGTAR